MTKKNTPINRKGWDSWRDEHLEFVKKHLSDKAEFDDFCSALKKLLDILECHYDEEEQLREKTDRQKEVGQDLKKLHKALNTAREKGLFKDLAPDFFMSVLIQCCETEYCKTYTKGTHDARANRHRTEFIAKTANLLFEFTGKPFQYSSKVDPLCLTVCECLTGINRGVTDSAVRDAINAHIQIIASTPPGKFPAASTSFNYEQLKSEEAKTDNLPRGYVYEEAVARYNPRETTTRDKDGFRHSFIIGDFLLVKLPGRPEEMVHPNLWLWIEYMAYKAIAARDRRARLLVDWLSGIDPKKIPRRISRGDVCCRWLVSKFRRQGDIYSGDDMLEIIHSCIRFVAADDSGKSDDKKVQYGSIGPGILELPCEPSDVIRMEAIIVDPIPVACPPDL